MDQKDKTNNETPTTRKEGTMSYYFDKTGNIYKIDDEKALRKKDTIEVFNEAGEEFGLPAKMANEFKLTPDERAKVVHEITTKILELLKALGLGGIGGLGGHGGGCPAVDPANLGSIAGTLAMSQESQVLAALLRGIIGHGGGCPAIDPAQIENILGSLVLPVQSQLLTALLSSWFRGGGCPAIDPVNLGSILGSVIQPAALSRGLGGGCPAIDPAQIQNILGTVAFQQLLGSLLRGRFGGGGCPNIDPANLGNILGSVIQLMTQGVR